MQSQEYSPYLQGLQSLKYYPAATKNVGLLDNSIRIYTFESSPGNLIGSPKFKREPQSEHGKK